MTRPCTILFATTGTLVAIGSAHAWVDTIYTVATDPGSQFGAPIASLDITSTSWDFPFEAPKLDSGFKAEILDPGGNPLILDPGVNPNTTSLRTDVYSVSSATTVGGGLNLLPGDLVFTYRIRLADKGANTNVVDTLQKFGIGGATGIFGGGGGLFDETIALARGITIDGLGTPTDGFPIDTGNDFEVFPDTGFGGFSQVDYDWGLSNQANHLANAEEVTLMLYARNAIVTDGFAKFIGVSGQVGPTTDTVANNAPILIPTFIPTPGASALLAVSGLAYLRRRR